MLSGCDTELTTLPGQTCRHGGCVRLCKVCDFGKGENSCLRLVFVRDVYGQRHSRPRHCSLAPARSV